MRTKLIQIGNSRGIRIPKPLLDHAGLRDAVDIDLENGSLIVRCADVPHAGWDAAFARMAAAGGDTLIDAGSLGSTPWDETEWQWK